MPPDALTGRDLELITVGTACLIAAAWVGMGIGDGGLTAMALFVAVGLISITLAPWDLQTR